jgi:large subunit ribosomal protein L6
MSRVGIKPIKIPEKVKIKVEKNLIEVVGPLGVLTQEIQPEIEVRQEGQKLIIKRKNDSKKAKSLHGLTRSLIANMITGVTEGWKKELEVQGTGYRVRLEGENLVLSVGFSHPVEIKPAKGIKFETEEEKRIIIRGVDKVLVGNLAAKIRKVRPPDAYKGKGIRYRGEEIKLKPGKAGKAGAAGGMASPGGGIG